MLDFLTHGNLRSSSQDRQYKASRLRLKVRPGPEKPEAKALATLSCGQDVERIHKGLCLSALPGPASFQTATGGSSSVLS